MIAVLIAILVFAISYYLIRRWRARSKIVPAISVDPWSSLATKMKQLSIPVAFDARAQREFFFSTSGLIRQAAELFSGLPLTDRTNHEIRQILQQKKHFPDDITDSLRRLLHTGELVQFAEKAANRDDGLKHLDVCHDLFNRLYTLQRAKDEHPLPSAAVEGARQ